MIIKLTPSHGEWDSWTSIKTKYLTGMLMHWNHQRFTLMADKYVLQLEPFPSCTNIWKATLTCALFLIKLLENDINDIIKKNFMHQKWVWTFFHRFQTPRAFALIVVLSYLKHENKAQDFNFVSNKISWYCGW